MTNPPESALELAIRSALKERAQSVSPTAPADNISFGRARPRRRTVLLLAAAAIVAFVVAGTVVLRPGPERRDRVVTTPVGLSGFGTEFPLVDSPPAEAEIAQMVRDARNPPPSPQNNGVTQHLVRDAHAVAVRTLDGALITKWTAQVDDATYRCVSGGNSRSCGDVLSPRPPEAPQNVVELGDDQTTYLVWLDLPPGTVYTTFTRGGSPRWQRPVHEMSVFTLPAVNGTPVRLAALDADRRELVAFDYTSTNGVFTADWPPWWKLDETIRWCAAAPLIDVERMINGGQSDRYRAYFPGVGAIDIGVRDACAQQAPLRPNPYGELDAKWTLRDQRLSANYFKRANGQAVPTPEARQQIADERARVKTYCTTHSKHDAASPGCERGN